MACYFIRMYSYTQNMKFIIELCSHNSVHGFLVHMLKNTLPELKHIVTVKLFDSFCLQWYLYQCYMQVLNEWNTSDSARRCFENGYERNRKLTESVTCKPIFFRNFILKIFNIYRKAFLSNKRTKLDYNTLYIGSVKYRWL